MLAEASQRLPDALERPGLASEKPEPASEGLSQPQRSLGGGTDVRTYVQTYRFPLCSTGLRPPLGPKPKNVILVPLFLARYMTLYNGFLKLIPSISLRGKKTSQAKSMMNYADEKPRLSFLMPLPSSMDFKSRSHDFIRS